MPLPYITIPDGHLGPLPIHPFGVLVALGVLIGTHLAMKRADERELGRAKMESFITWCLGFGFVLSHVLDEVMYRPHEMLKNPLVLFKVWAGISSFGGFFGGVVGAYAWSRAKRERLLPYLEQVGAVFPIAWIFGRSGCSLAHDHIGRISHAWYAVAFPGGPRLDLGLLELMATIPIAAITYWFARRARPEGSILALVCLLYAPIRFQLDSMRAVDIREPDARYAGMTPGQWLSMALVVVGAALLAHAWRARGRPPVAGEPRGTTTRPTPPTSTLTAATATFRQ